MESLDMQQIYCEIGKSVKSQRKARRMTQEALAAQLDITSQYLSRIERGVVRPSLELLYNLASVLDIPIYTLLPSSLAPQRGFLSEDISYRMNHCTDQQKFLVVSFVSWVLSQ